MKVMDRQETQADERVESDADVLHLIRPGAGVLLPDHAEQLDAHDGVRAAIAMFHAGEVSRREFFELCFESTQAIDGPHVLHLGESA